MADLLTSLTSLAVSVFREQGDETYRDPVAELVESMWRGDAVLRDAQSSALVMPSRHPAIEPFVEQIFAESDT